MDKDLTGRTLGELERLIVGMGQQRYLAGYIFGFIHRRGVAEIAQISPLSKAFRSRLAEEGYFISRLTVLDKRCDPDGTVKFVFGLGDGGRVETVLLSDGDRRTVCVSTQLGCAMDCVFCATGKLGLRRNLSAGEIVNQIHCVEKEAGRINNIVFMGMGEPLLNYDAVLGAVRILNHPAGRNIGIRHITISTCGIVAGIERLAGEDVRPRLAISLNAPTEALRRRIMPVAGRCSLADLLAAVRLYQSQTGDRVTFEYVLIAGLNDKVMHAQSLAKLVRGIMCNVNLIEFNPHPGCRLAPSSTERIDRFASVLRKAGIETAVRYKRGQSISAACGQLGADWTDSQRLSRSQVNGS